MDTITRNSIEDRWHQTEKPALLMIKRRAIALCAEIRNAIDHKDFGYYAAPNNELRGYGADVAGWTHTTVSNLLFLARREADNAGLEPSLLHFDMSDLEEEVARWK